MQFESVASMGFGGEGDSELPLSDSESPVFVLQKLTDVLSKKLDVFDVKHNKVFFYGGCSVFCETRNTSILFTDPPPKFAAGETKGRIHIRKRIQ